MKTIFTLAFAFLATVSFSQIEGTWKLDPVPAALGVGPTQGDIGWWSNDAQAVIDRACLFDDSITFDASGTMTHYMDNSTWLEVWQGVGAESCGVPVAPHDGNPASPYTYVYDATAGTLTVNGMGAHLGLPKATNQGELSVPNPPAVPSSIVYNVVFSNNDNTMTVDCDFGGGWWRYVYTRTNVAPPTPKNITISVDMSQYGGTIGTAVNLSGTFNNWCGDCAPMTDMGNDVYELTVMLDPGAIEYKFSVDNWTDQEVLVDGMPCTVTNGGFTNRTLDVTVDETVPTVCWNSCAGCPLGIEDANESMISVTPNPVTNSFVLNFEGAPTDIVIYDMTGRVVKNIAGYTSGTAIEASDLESGAFIVVINGTESAHKALFVKE